MLKGLITTTFQEPIDALWDRVNVRIRARVAILKLSISSSQMLTMKGRLHEGTQAGEREGRWWKLLKVRPRGHP